LAAERIAWRHARENGLEIVIVRPPLVYGPGDHDVLQLIRSARRGVIAQPGLEPCTFSAIYVDDLVQGLISAAAHGHPLPRDADDHVLAGGGQPREQALEQPLDPRGRGIYYLTDGATHTATSLGRHAARALSRRAWPVRFPSFMVFALAHALELIGRAVGRLPTLTVDKARGSLVGWWCDDRRARAELGFSSPTDMAEGMRKTVAWYRARGVL
jgi:nucleoside-diphosphate-sugar epimerase